MKNSGKAMQAALKLIVSSLIIVLAVCALGIIAKYVHALIDYLAFGLVGLWLVFVAFTLYFFRDPEARVPQNPKVILSPGHGKVDVITDYEEKEFFGGRCRRVSIFLSPLDVHVQKAVISGRIGYVKHNTGKFLSAMRTECGLQNENVLIGFESPEVTGGRVGVRLIAGVLARRIIPWVQVGEPIARGERISLIQFGSRCDIYLPMDMEVTVKLGDRVAGGESIIARYR
jgi:phosphatidylserine decarboxylase